MELENLRWQQRGIVAKATQVGMTRRRSGHNQGLKGWWESTVNSDAVMARPRRAAPAETFVAALPGIRGIVGLEQ